MRSVHLLITGLVPDFGHNTSEILRGVDLPGMRKIQARGRPQAIPESEYPPGLTERLAMLFTKPNAQRLPNASLPIAPLRLALDGVDPGEGHWFCADPVHLLLMLDHLRMGGTPPISSSESAELVAWLNHNFAGEAEFIAPTPAHWYVRFNRPVIANTTPPDACSGESIEPHLPKGDDSKYLRRLSNEIQMLLHAHPLREAREAQGAPAINSLWIWGGGPRVAPERAFESVYSDEPISQALACGLASELASRAQAPWHPRPADFSDALLEAGRTLVVINALHASATQGDFAAWREEVERFERAWFAPLLLALQRGQIDELVFESVGKGAATWRLGRLDAWKFWKG